MRLYQQKGMQHDGNRLHLHGIIHTFLSFLLGVSSSFAQPFLSLDEAISLGLENNFGIRIAQNESYIATNNNTAGNAGFLPEITLAGGYEKGWSNAEVRVVSGTELDDPSASMDWIDAGVFLEWTLFDGMNMFVNRDRLKTLQEMGELETRMAVEQTISSIIILYHGIIRNQMMEKVLREQVDLSRERTQIAETRNTIGRASELEYLQAQVDLNADELALMQQQTILSNTRIALNEVLARDVTLTFQVTDTILLKDHLDIETLKEHSIKSNTGLLIEQYDRKLDQLNLRSLQGIRYPTLLLHSGYSFVENETEASFIQYNRQFGPYVGLSLEFTLFDGMNRSREVQNARIDIENAKLKEQEVQLNLFSSLKQHSNQYENELRVIDLEQKNLALAERNMDIASESYRLGTLSAIELREIQENLLEAHSRMIAALFRVKVQETELLRISGYLIQL